MQTTQPRPRRTKIIIAVSVVGLALIAGGYVLADRSLQQPGESLIERYLAKPLRANLDDFEPTRTLDTVQRSYEDLGLTCYDEPKSSLGNYVCWAPIAEYRGASAKLVAFFFQDQRLSTVRISFDAENHINLFSRLKQEFGEPQLIKEKGDAYGENLIGWERSTGIVAISQNVAPGRESAILWVGHGTHLGSEFSSAFIKTADAVAETMTDGAPGVPVTPVGK